LSRVSGVMPRSRYQALVVRRRRSGLRAAPAPARQERQSRDGRPAAERARSAPRRVHRQQQRASRDLSKGWKYDLLERRHHSAAGRWENHHYPAATPWPPVKDLRSLRGQGGLQLIRAAYKEYNLQVVHQFDFSAASIIVTAYRLRQPPSR
jgi:hypothetical protein